MSLWTLDDALLVYRSIEGPLREIGWWAAIGGGTVWRGQSDHDLDIVVIPYDKTNCDIADVQRLLFDLGWTRKRTVLQMQYGWRKRGLTDTKHVEEWAYLDGKRIDIISPATEVREEYT